MNLCNFKFTEQRLKEIFVSQDEPHQGNIVDETMKAEIDLEHVEKVMPFNLITHCLILLLNPASFNF
jgi:hypothetical protein